MMESLAITNKLEEARRELAELETVENSLYKTRDDICCHSWRVGRVLTELKEEIGHGKWLIWLRGNWPQHELRAQRCMAFFRTNEDWKENKSVEFDGFERNSVRKLFGGYTPEKERLQLAGDVTDSPAPHHLTPINQFTKYFRQVRSGLGEWPDQEIFRREIEPILQIILRLAGATEFHVRQNGIWWT
jgi:rRNA maturation protein Nop10